MRTRLTTLLLFFLLTTGADASVIQALLIATTLMQLSGPLWTLWPLKHIVDESGDKP